MSLSDHQTKFLEVLTKLSQKKIAQAITLLLIIYIAYITAQISWLLAPSSSITKTIISSHTAPKSSARNVDISLIQRLNLFGHYNEQVVESTIDVKDAPETHLNLILTGVVASTEKATGAAIIENNGRQNTYGIGDIITGTRATLAQVMRDRVLIMQSGRLETLMLDGFKYQKTLQNSQYNRIKTMSDNNAKPISPRSSRLIKRNSLHQMTPQRAIDQRKNKALTEKMTRLKRDVVTNPSKITDYLKISPMRKQGKLYGYRLMPGKDKEFFKSSGLKMGDIATQLNGFELSQPRQAALALKALREDTQVSLTIDRHGEIKQILFSIN